MSTPRISTHRILTLRLSTPRILTPRILTLRMSTPRISTHRISTLRMSIPTLRVSTLRMSTLKIVWPQPSHKPVKSVLSKSVLEETDGLEDFQVCFDSCRHEDSTTWKFLWLTISCPDQVTIEQFLSCAESAVLIWTNTDYMFAWCKVISLAYAHAWMMWHYSIGLSKIKTVDSAQPGNRSIVTRPFSSWEGGVWAWDYWPAGLWCMTIVRCTSWGGTDCDRL